MQHAVASFDIESWDEKPSDEPSLVRATVRGNYTGDLVGTGTWLMVMHYGTERTGCGVWLERVTDRLGDREGSFVLQHSCHFADGAIVVSFEIVPGSGTGDLAALRGHGGYRADEGRTIPKVTLDYEFAE